MNGIITKGGNLQGAVPPSKAAGDEFQMRMILDAIDYHENGDDEDGPCCTGDAPCQTRIFLVGQQRKLAGIVISDREAQIETAKEERKAQTPGGSAQTRTAKVADPASDAQIRFIRSLNEQRDCSKIGTFPRRTLDAILADQEVSKGRASRLIEVMQRQPQNPTPEIQTATAPTGPAPSPAQLGFLRTLAAENGEDMPEVPTKADASREITRLIQAREDRKKNGSAPTPGKAVDHGMYEKDGVVYKVQIAVHGSGRPYAKKLVQDDEGEWSFVKAPGMQFRLTPADRMTRERAQELGRSVDSPLYGTCCVCGRTLTDETSIAEGIGPKCGSRF